MTRRLTGAVVATVAALALAGVATANHHGAKVYRATLAKTAAADTAQLPDVRGRAQLVDGKRNNKVSIHVKGLKPGETYKWHVHSDAATTADPCATQTGPILEGWTYRRSMTPNEGVLTANAAGNASGKGRSSTFAVDAGKVYFVNVHLADGTPIACGVMKSKAKKAHGKSDEEHGKSKDKEKSSSPCKSEEGKEHGHGPKPGKGRA